jgi:hypothetical protein
VPALAGDRVTALDIALPGNRDALLELLARGVQVRYVDHHEPGPLPRHPLLEALIDTDPEVCTSVLVDRMLEGSARAWAVVGAFGDNLAGTANRLADALGCDSGARARWRELGESINYNAYGLSEDDLVYRPAELYRALAPFRDPDRFVASQPHAARLAEARTADLGEADSVRGAPLGGGARLYLLPDARWARRVFGSLANRRVELEPRLAHAVAVPRPGGAQFLVSLRVPPGGPASAHDLCSPFGGGGRKRAAGIDHLSAQGLEAFANALAAAFPRPANS